MFEEYELAEGPGPAVLCTRERLRALACSPEGEQHLREHYIRVHGMLPPWLSTEQLLAMVEHDIEVGRCHLRVSSWRAWSTGALARGEADDAEPPELPFDADVEVIPFEIHFVDELGEPVAVSFRVRFVHDGEEEEVATDAQGVARITYSSGSTFAHAQVASPADVGTVSEHLRLRWNQAPRWTGREDEIVTPGDDVDVVLHRFEPRHEIPDWDAPPSSSSWRSELETRHFRLHHRTKHVVSVQPYVVRARLLAMFFDTNKCFLLPEAIASMRRIREIYQQNRWTKLLVVGHTDRSGDPSINDPLSLERAESVAAYLRDDVEAWLTHYGADRPWHQRWGTREDHLMIGALADEALGAGNLTGASPARWYQQWHNELPPAGRAPTHEPLAVDGVIGPLTRRQLVADYMNRDGTSLPRDVELIAHGCGESFPIDETGDGIEPTAAGPNDDARDRRVELYFFDLVMGVQPAPPGAISPAGSAHYPEWRARSRHTWDLRLGAGGQAAVRPQSWFGYRRSFPKPSIFPALREVARRMAANPLSHLVIVGHTDTNGSNAENHALSLARAEAVRALLTSDGEDLLARFDRPDPHEPWSWEEVQWLLHGVEVAGEPVYVGAADGVVGPATAIALGVFQGSEPGLPVLYHCDEPTLERLVSRYCEGALGAESPPPRARIDCVGAGHWHPPRPLGPVPADWSADVMPITPWSGGMRRVELFLFDVAPSPSAEEFPTSPGDTRVYDAWCDAVEEEVAVLPRPLWVQVLTTSFRPRRTSVSLTSAELGGAGGAVALSPRGAGRTALPHGAYVAEVAGDTGPVRYGIFHAPDETCGTLILLPLRDPTAPLEPAS